MKLFAKLTVLVALFGLSGCIALNQDWTSKPAAKTDYVPGQNYQLLTNVFFASRDSFSPALFLRKNGNCDGMLDAGTRLRVTTVHYNGDSFEVGFYTTVCAEAINGPFRGTNFNISFLSANSWAFIARNTNVLVPVDAVAPDLNTNHFAWAVEQISSYRGVYTWDWWKRCEEEPDIIFPVEFLLRQKQADMLVVAYHNAATPEAKAYAIAALRRLDDHRVAELAGELIAKKQKISVSQNGVRMLESTTSVISRMQQEVEVLFPRR
ncbi:MAG: hypothetical protein QM813_14040 [Verrucomicrobiota bacterium]